MINNKPLTIGVCLLFLLVVISTGCQESEKTDGRKKVVAISCPETPDVIKVQGIEGYVNSTGGITDFRVKISLHSQPRTIDLLNDLTIRMSWVDQESGGIIAGTADLVEANNSAVDSLDANVYWAEPTIDPHGSFKESGILDLDSQVIIHITTWELKRSPAKADFGDNNGLNASSTGNVNYQPLKELAFCA
ncbi:MAG: hypothetical protein QGH39_06335 [Candidatus Thermoplasmatota archaeon]|jgi:hypothetical protein|nr:hypothetical protein [Candidatus Thermoplasmatota archaeon]